MDAGCDWHPDDAGYVTLDEALANLTQLDCPLPADIAGFVSAIIIKDRNGHELDGDFDPQGHGGCDHRDTPEWQAEHPPTRKRQEAKMDNTKTISSAPEGNPQPMMLAVATNVIPVEATISSAPEATATVGVDQAISQVKSLLPGGADASPALLIGGAAALAVVGAGIKFGPQMLKARAEKAAQEHEARMKALEIEQQKAEQQKQDDQHQACSAARMALEARVVAAEAKASALEARLSEVAAKADKAGEGGGFDLGDFDPEALEKRIAAIEKAVKPAPKAKGKR